MTDAVARFFKLGQRCKFLVSGVPWVVVEIVPCLKTSPNCPMILLSTCFCALMALFGHFQEACPLFARRLFTVLQVKVYWYTFRWLFVLPRCFWAGCSCWILLLFVCSMYLGWSYEVLSPVVYIAYVPDSTRFYLFLSFLIIFLLCYWFMTRSATCYSFQLNVFHVFWP